MPTLRQLSRMLFTPAKGDKTKKNGRPVKDRAKPTSVVTQPPRMTRDGYPLGERRYPKSWVVFIEPLAYTKLMTWYQGSRGLELSGYALLSEPVNVSLDRETHFHVKDLMLVCAIQESSGGYTEMSAQQRVQAMMKARELGYKANQLGWWHHHPVNTWSSTDLNTLRQRVHELGLPEVLQAFAFVLTSRGILARWDQSGPNEGDNIYVDEIPVVVGSPELLKVMEQAKAEVKELLAQRTRGGEQAPEKPLAGQSVEMPVASWQRPAFRWGLWRQPTLWDDWQADEEIYLQELAYAEAVLEALGPNENPDEFVCRQDPDTLVDIDACATCPFVEGCFHLNLLEEYDDPS